MENSKTNFRPILFSTPMVQALLEGRKTMTRRTKGLEKVNENPNDWDYKGIVTFANSPSKKDDFKIFNSFENKESKIRQLITPPYEVGDVFWVRENYYTASNWDHWKPSMLKSVNVEVFYEADLPNYDIPRPLSRGKIRPCIFLPKEYARIFLKIKSIRVERLQDISEEDAISEGVKEILPQMYVQYKTYENYINPDNPYGHKSNWSCAVGSFLSLWKSINGKGSWDLNPFVFVYEFEQIEKPKDFIV